MCRTALIAGSIFLMAVTGKTYPDESRGKRADVVIYGGTSAAISAAVQVSRMGKSVLIVCPETHLGGMTTNGLGMTDSGKKSVIGGIAREFYQRIKHYYDTADAWKWQQPGDYPHYKKQADAMWVFEPHVAEMVCESLIAEAHVPVYRNEWLDRQKGVHKSGNRIEAITMLSGHTYRGREFIDATYEGDLMAAAGVSYTVGREPNSQYGETLNGVQTRHARYHQFMNPVDPYRIPGDPSSGLVARVHDGGPGREGEGDNRIQAYCFRLCLTDEPRNRTPFPRPEGYDPEQYELLARYFETGWTGPFCTFTPAPNRKTDTNNNGAFSTDDIGMNYDFPEADYDHRKAIIAEHEQYEKGFFWFLGHDKRVPKSVRDEISRWGLAKDEFTDNGNWPHQIYIREARRMVSNFVMTEGHLRGTKPIPRPVGMGSYNMDSHNVQRYVDQDTDGRALVHNEGDVQVSPGRAYPISYDALVPREKECANLLVPVCVSSSHIAYGSIRMEPVFFILGQSAATAAVLAIGENVPVQKVDYTALRKRLEQDGQCLETARAKK